MSSTTFPGISGPELLNGAVRAFEARDRDAAAALLGAVAERDPPLGDTWGSVARLAALIGEVEIALTAARRWVRVAPGDPDRRLMAGAIIAGNGRVEEALSMMTAFATRYPNDPRLSHFTATCHAQLGQAEAAIADARRSLAHQTGGAAAMTWLTLADLKTFTPDDPDLASLTAVATALRGRDNAMEGAALYALAKARLDVGQPQAAFEAIAAGAALIRRQRPHDRAATSAYVERMIAGSTPAHQAALPASQASSARPIFVLSAPRSGSTLVEQILTSHSQVAGGAELNLFNRAALALGNQLPEDQAAFARRPDAESAWTRIGESYLRLLTQRFGPEGRVVDKTLSHTRLVGLISAILPGARFVWLRRDPGATAWSCLKTYFAQGLDWSWSQEDIAAYLRDEDRLHAHWTSLFPDTILTVPYEGLVSEPDAWIAKILAHCGLESEPGLRDFHQTRRVIQTASVSQVRRPLYASSIDDWRAVEQGLTPFLAAYHG